MNTTIELEALSHQLLQEGRVIEAGFVGLRIAAISKDASPTQINEMRMAFFAGAQHLFATIMTILDPGAEPTARDLRRMDAINQELQRFIREFALRQLPTQGSSQ